MLMFVLSMYAKLSYSLRYKQNLSVNKATSSTLHTLSRKFPPDGSQCVPKSRADSPAAVSA